MTNDYDHNIHSNPDAMAWAKFFMETIKKNKCTIDNIDEGLMVAWFANAMMAIHDHIYQTKNVSEKTTPDIATLQKQLADGKGPARNAGGRRQDVSIIAETMGSGSQ